MEPDSFKPIKKRFSIWKLIGILFCVILTSIVLVSSLLKRQYRSHLQSQISELQAAGYPVSFADLQPDPIPDEDNAAVLLRPLFFKFFGKTGLMDSKISGAIQTILETTGAYTKAERAEAETILLAFLQEHKSDIEKIHLAVKKPRCQFAHRYKDGFNMLLEQETNAREFAKLICAAGTMHSHASQWDEAVRCAVTTARLQIGPGEDHILISQLIGWAMLGMSFDLYHKLLVNPDTLSDAQLQQLLQGLPDPKQLHEMIDILNWERAFAIGAFQQLRKHGGMTEVFNLDSKGLETLYGASPLMELDMTNMLSLYNALQQDLENTELANRTAVSNYKKTVDALPPYCILTSMIAPTLVHTEKTYVNTYAKLIMTRLILILELHKRAHGSFPDSLEIIEGDWINPYNGKLISYQHDSDTYSLKTEIPDGPIQWPEAETETDKDE